MLSFGAATIATVAGAVSVFALSEALICGGVTAACAYGSYKGMQYEDTKQMQKLETLSEIELEFLYK